MQTLNSESRDHTSAIAEPGEQNKEKSEIEEIIRNGMQEISSEVSLYS
jgi:hypothetical protein